MKIIKWRPKIKIISGGQTGVDRAALDVSIKFGIKHGGYCPKGRLAEDGMIPLKYTLEEINSSDYSERTLKNIQKSDGSLIIYCGSLYGGTKMTKEYCNVHNKPVFEINLLDNHNQIKLNFVSSSLLVF